MTESEQLTLLDWTARKIVSGKSGSTPSGIASSAGASWAEAKGLAGFGSELR